MRQLDWTSGALILGCILGGVACLVAAVQQVRTGETRGLMPERVALDERPGYFWFLFWGRIVLGVAGIALGLFALSQPAPGA